MTAVSELHLEGLGACGSGQQLMSKTDTENWRSGLSHGGLDMDNGILHHGGVTRTVGDEQTVILLAGQFGKVVVPRNDLNLNSALEKAPQLVELETNVHTDDSKGTTGWMLESSAFGWRVNLNLLGRH